MSRQEAQTGSATSEYSTVPELAKTIRRNRKTVYGWIATGEIGEAAGPCVVQGRFLCSAEVPLPDSGRRKCRQINPTPTDQELSREA
jgi:hypothetical protein